MIFLTYIYTFFSDYYDGVGELRHKLPSATTAYDFIFYHSSNDISQLLHELLQQQLCYCVVKWIIGLDLELAASERICYTNLKRNNRKRSYISKFASIKHLIL